MTNNRYSIDAVFDMIGEECLNISSMSNSPKESIEVDGYKVYRRSLRYATFYQKGCRCASCGKEGVYFQLDEGDEYTNNVPSNRRHFNLYAADGTLITKDHILPKKWGGKDIIDNLQPMCSSCNSAKGSKCDLDIQGVVATRTDNSSKVKYYATIEDGIYDIVNNTKIFNKKLKPGMMARKIIDISIKIHNAINEGRSAYGYYWKYDTFNVNNIKS